MFIIRPGAKYYAIGKDMYCLRGPWRNPEKKLLENVCIKENWSWNLTNLLESTTPQGCFQWKFFCSKIFTTFFILIQPLWTVTKMTWFTCVPNSKSLLLYQLLIILHEINSCWWNSEFNEIKSKSLYTVSNTDSRSICILWYNSGVFQIRLI